ncbi:aminobenzoyl-glutamate utilization protein B [Alteribacillus persepolensis]|uniref:Aminobenzoyl-glutamate utilization protein B n=1 Tax=Alteribacillus persepolensis TaxID=568899 RepID=A0A1G8F457_9BACI|nr:M20 family metallopeptidase [Alteribacillus persepolensis]SDH76933.1 aminobenzoyl-glutamate utilization protein B [Alteribacillus persepolensis]
MEHTKEINDIIEQYRDIFIDVSDNIWDFAETSFFEHQSAAVLMKRLEEEGFRIQKDIAGMDTAFIAEYGYGNPVVAVLGEYDALAGLSQERGIAEKKPVQEGGNGHGCGHNLLGVGSFAAAIAVKAYMDKHELKGTIRYYGCPAEESGDGKVFMVRDGVFDDVDAAVTWHPAPINGVIKMNILATYQVYFHFKGRSAHAAAAPHLGRSALDAVELMNIGVNYLREHVVPEARMHYAVTKTGGSSPNVVQSEAEVLYLLRAPKVAQVEEIYQRVKKIAAGAAQMTETELEVVFDSGTSDLLPNETLDAVMARNYEKLQAPVFDEEEYQLAKDIRTTLHEGEKNSVWGKGLENVDLTDTIIPQSDMVLSTGSTDVADVSWVAPTVQCAATCMANGTALHSWQAVSQAGSSIGKKGMLHAGKVMASTAVDMLLHPHLIDQAKEDFKKATNGQSYMCPIPEDVKPGTNI